VARFHLPAELNLASIAIRNEIEAKVAQHAGPHRPYQKSANSSAGTARREIQEGCGSTKHKQLADFKDRCKYDKEKESNEEPRRLSICNSHDDRRQEIGCGVFNATTATRSDHLGAR